MSIATITPVRILSDEELAALPIKARNDLLDEWESERDAATFYDADAAYERHLETDYRLAEETAAEEAYFEAVGFLRGLF